MRFVLRTGHVYRQFEALTLTLRSEARCRTAVLDGELVSLDDYGPPDFLRLLYRRGTPSFVAFYVLAVDGRDVRDESFVVPKRRLRRIIPTPATSVLAMMPIVGDGVALHEAVCVGDLEGIVAKRISAPYRIAATTLAEDREPELLTGGGTPRTIRPAAGEHSLIGSWFCTFGGPTARFLRAEITTES